MKKMIYFLMICGLLPLCVHATDDRNSIPSLLKAATVYRTGAELTHTANAILQQGNNEIQIEGLSNALDINSVQIGTDARVTILSVAFTSDFLKPAVKSGYIQKLEDSVNIISKDLSKLQVLIKTDNELLELLKANKEIRGTQTGLSVTELMKMMDYYKSKTLEVQNELYSYHEKENKQSELIQRLQLQINEEEQRNTKSTGRLHLQLNCPVAGNCNFTISYITSRASWNPAYDIRVENISKPINLLYKAKLQQTTGIDWKQVKLTLASASPNQNNNAPVLKSWFLTYSNPVTRMENNLYMNSIQSMLQGKVAGVSLNEVVVVGYSKAKDNLDEQVEIRGKSTINKPTVPIYVLNGKVISRSEFENIDPANIKSVEQLTGAESATLYGASGSAGAIIVSLKENLGDYITVRDAELNINYDIALPYDVPGNGKEQSVTLKEVPVNTLYKYYSVPKLDKDAYLLGEIAEWGKLNLLPGEANIIFEGTFIGKSFIDPNSTNDTLNLTLGRDKRIVVKKEKLKDFSSVKFMGSNRKQIFTYEITVKNNKKEAIQMLLKDQYPISTNKEIEVELLETTAAVNNTDLGVLTWKLQLAAGETQKYTVRYSVKYPKDKYINLAP